MKSNSKIDFNNLSSATFTRLVTDLLQKLGFVNLQFFNNAEVDAIAEFYEQDPFWIETRKVYAIETKFYRHSRADPRGIQQLITYVANDPKIDKALLITDGNLTSPIS